MYITITSESSMYITVTDERSMYITALYQKFGISLLASGKMAAESLSS